MRLRQLLVCAGVLCLTGCTTTAGTTTPSEAPVRQASSTAPSQAATSSPAAPIPVPTRKADEVSRDVYNGKLYDGAIYDIAPGTESLDLQAACAGHAGTRMRYQVQDGKGNEISTGDLPCNGKQITTRVSGTLPRAAPIHLSADAGVTNGWAALSHP